MSDTIYVLKLGNYLYGGNVLHGEKTISTVTNNLFEAKCDHDRKEVERWREKFGGEILQVEIKSHTIPAFEENKMRKVSGLEALYELEKLANPLQEWLKANYDPMCEIIISEEEIKVLSEETSIPTESNC